jgi:hypothetical protein
MLEKKEILYPIFIECCKFCPDLYWSTIFEELSYGKTPYGVYISKNFLCCSYKDKEFSYKIEKKNPEKMFEDVYNLLSKKVGLLSYQEKIQKKMDFYTLEDSIKDGKQNWSDIKKKNTKDLLIEKYIIEMKKKHSLTIKQARYLSSLIYITMVFKVITQKDIKYENGKIQEIEGLDFNRNKIILQRDFYNLETDFSATIVIDRKNMFESWDKYLRDLQKLVEN